MNAFSCMAVIAFVGGAAHAGVLYKSVWPNGVIEFSDSLRDGAVVVARIEDGYARPVDDEAPRRAGEGVTRASGELDLAEHALALARSTASLPPDKLRFAERGYTPAETSHVAYARKNVLNARRTLLEAVSRQRRAAATAASQ